MKISDHWRRRPIAICMVILLIAPFVEAGAANAQQTVSGQSSASVSSSGKQPLDDSRKAAAESNAASGPVVGTASSSTHPDGPDAGRLQSSQQLQDRSETPQTPKPGEGGQNGGKQPVGTAAAPYEKPIGVPASRPAGAVIAPAKQKRAFSILIKVGLIVGAAVAVGTVVGLSKSSPSRP